MDGLILAPTQTGPAQLMALLADGPPVVLMDRRLEGVPWDWVAVDVAAGLREAIAYLAGRGRRRIAFLAGPEGISTAEDKLAGYRAGLAAQGQDVDPSLVVAGDYTAAGGYEATRRLLAQTPRPDAVIAANNLSAIGMTRAVLEGGLRVPDDLALVGFDNTPWTTLVRPALTLVAQPVAALGTTAARLLLDRLERPAGRRPLRPGRYCWRRRSSSGTPPETRLTTCSRGRRPRPRFCPEAGGAAGFGEGQPGDAVFAGLAAEQAVLVQGAEQVVQQRGAGGDPGQSQAPAEVGDGQAGAGRHGTEGLHDLAPVPAPGALEAGGGSARRRPGAGADRGAGAAGQRAAA